jgi:hypothetical protein
MSAEILNHAAMPKAEEAMPKDDRVRRAYESFRSGFSHNPPENWDNASNLVRDVARVGYAQGLVDGAEIVSPSAALHVLLTSIDFDGMDPNSLTIGEIRRALIERPRPFRPGSQLCHGTTGE